MIEDSCVFSFLFGIKKNVCSYFDFTLIHTEREEKSYKKIPLQMLLQRVQRNDSVFIMILTE
ncbi:hypothetical protein CN635_23075 [Priestia aryabhattai]|nr:hypothetical protein CN635_23075 [Priestia aryabhattai]PHF75410.1 hypothetical protein COI42_09805 [Priestia aryabhattai]TPF16632.1 hypothetical protein CBE78_10095 [Priestia megaterium]